MRIDKKLIQQVLEILRDTDGNTAIDVISNLDTDFIVDRLDNGNNEG